MKRVRQVRPEPGYRLWVEFEDGVAGTLDLSSELDGPVFEPLRDARAFEQVVVDEFGAICWPNGGDLAPEVVYSELAARLRQAS